jgi:hypothetical protein
VSGSYTKVSVVAKGRMVTSAESVIELCLKQYRQVAGERERERSRG